MNYYIIILECIFSGLITLIISKILIELKLDKRINFKRKPIEIYISCFITGVLLQFISKII